MTAAANEGLGGELTAADEGLRVGLTAADEGLGGELTGGGEESWGGRDDCSFGEGNEGVASGSSPSGCGELISEDDRST